MHKTHINLIWRYASTWFCVVVIAQKSVCWKINFCCSEMFWKELIRGWRKGNMVDWIWKIIYQQVYIPSSLECKQIKKWNYFDVKILKFIVTHSTYYHISMA